MSAGLYEDGRAALYLRRAEGRVVGQPGSQRCVLFIKGQEVIAHWGVNFFVLPELQRAGIGASLVRARRADTPISLSIDATPAATRVAKRSGNESLGTVLFYVLRRGVAVGYVVLRSEPREGLLDGMIFDFVARSWKDLPARRWSACRCRTASDPAPRSPPRASRARSCHRWPTPARAAPDSG